MYFIKRYDNKSLLDEFNSFFGLQFKSNDMRTDISETENEYTLNVDLPGFDKKDVSITYDDGKLTITAEYNNESDDESKGYIKRERISSSISRTYYLENVDDNKIKATLNNGVLAIIAPKLTHLPNNTKRINVE